MFHFQFVATFSLVFIFSNESFSSGMLQSTVKTYSSWKQIKDAQMKDCKNEASLSQTSPDPKTMVGATIRNRRQLYIPTTLTFKAQLDSSVKAKLEAIDKLAKAKAIDVLKVSKKFPLELAEKSTGLGLTSEADLTPQDFLKKFDYQRACECLNNTQNIAKDEASYNKIAAQAFMIKEEHNKVKCFTDHAEI